MVDTVQVNFNSLTGKVVDARLYGVSSDQFGYPFHYTGITDTNFQAAAGGLGLTALRLNWNIDTMNLIYPTSGSVSTPDWTWVDPLINNLNKFFNLQSSPSTGNLAITIGWPSWLDISVSGNYATYTTMVQQVAQHFKDNGVPVYYWTLTQEPDGAGQNLSNVCSMYTAMRAGVRAVDTTYKCGGLDNGFYHQTNEHTFAQVCTVDFLTVHEHLGGGEPLSTNWPDAVSKALSTTYQNVRDDLLSWGLPATTPIWVDEFNWDGNVGDTGTGMNGLPGAVWWALRTGVVGTTGVVQMMGRRALLNDNEYGAIVGSSNSYTVLPPGYAIAKLGVAMPGNVVATLKGSTLTNLHVLGTARTGSNSLQLINYDQTTTYAVNITGFSGVTVSYWEQSAAHPNGSSSTIPVGNLASLNISPMSIVIVSSSVAAPIVTGAPSPPPQITTTWNPADKSSALVLSNSNLTATTVGAGDQSVRSTTSKTTGKWYFEITMVTGTSDFSVGVGNSTFNLGSGVELGGEGNGVGYYPISPSQSIYFNSQSTPLSIGTAVDVNGAVLSCAVDFTNSLIWFSSPAMRTQAGGLNKYNNSSSADPATGVGGLSFAGLTGPYFVIYNEDLGGGVATVNFGLQTLARTVPTGFTTWDTAVAAPVPPPAFPPPAPPPVPVPPPVVPPPVATPPPSVVPPPIVTPPVIGTPPPIGNVGPPLTDVMTQWWTAMGEEITANADLFVGVNIYTGDPQASTGQADQGVINTPAAAVVKTLFGTLPIG